MSKKTVLLKTIAPLVLAGVVLSGCSGSPTPEKTQVTSATLKANWGGFPDSWAPGTPMEPGYMRVPYENLVMLGDDGTTIEPLLATSWEQTPTDITLVLRDDVTFHDGTPFNAEAVKANIEFVRDSPGQFSGALKVVTNVEVVDEYTVKIVLARPALTFMTMLTQRNLPIGSPAAIADGSIATHPVGTSPWAYDEKTSVEGTKMSFLEFADYWGEMPGFANVELYGIADDTAATAALLSGEIDVTDSEEDQAPTIEAAPNVDSVVYPAIRNNIVFFDRGPGGVFEDVSLRQALCLTANNEAYKEIDTGVLYTPQQHFLEGEFGYSSDITGYPFTTKAADAAFAKAGSPAVSAVFPAAPFNKKQLEFFTDGMNELAGVDITVQELPVPQFITDWNSGKYSLGVGNNPQITPYDWYTTWFAEQAGSNPAHSESPELKAAAQKAIAAGVSEDSEGLWADVMKVIIDDEALACAFTVASEIVVWNTDTVAGAAKPSQAWEQNLINYRDLKPAQ